MPRKPTGKPVGPPKKPINWDQFEQLCALQCTQSEIASMFHIHRDTLSDRTKENYGEDYSTIYKRFSESGKCSLRRNQFVLSKKNAAMAIWLGKQWLDQKENNEQVVISPEIASQFDNVMKQISKAQSSSKIETIKSINEQKS